MQETTLYHRYVVHHISNGMISTMSDAYFPRHPKLGIQFVQIGNNPKATEFLTELDDDLSRTHGVRDIVDTTPYTGGVLTAELMIKMLLGGINRRVDRRGARSVMSQ